MATIRTPSRSRVSFLHALISSLYFFPRKAGPSFLYASSAGATSSFPYGTEDDRPFSFFDLLHEEIKALADLRELLIFPEQERSRKT